RSGTCMRAFLASEAARWVKQAVVCEPTSLKAGTRHRGVMAVRAEVVGPGGHSSRADELPSPLARLAHLAVGLDGWGRGHRKAGPPGFPGVALTRPDARGGVASNVVPRRGDLTFSLRPPRGADLDAIAAELERRARRLCPEATLEVTWASPPFQ